MKIIVNNASMTFIKGVLNIFENSTWLDGYYWNRNVGNSMTMLSSTNYFTIETPLVVPQGMSKVKVTWDAAFHSSGDGKLRLVWWGSDDRVLSGEEYSGGSVEVEIPSGATKFAVQGLRSAGDTYWAKIANIKGVFE